MHDVSLVDVDEELEGVAEDEHQDDANQHRRDVKVPGNKFENNNKKRKQYTIYGNAVLYVPWKLFRYYIWESAQECIFLSYQKMRSQSSLHAPLSISFLFLLRNAGLRTVRVVLMGVTSVRTSARWLQISSPTLNILLGGILPCYSAKPLRSGLHKFTSGVGSRNKIKVSFFLLHFSSSNSLWGEVQLVFLFYWFFYLKFIWMSLSFPQVFEQSLFFFLKAPKTSFHHPPPPEYS